VDRPITARSAGATTPETEAPPPEASDERLIAAVRAGDLTAYDDLMRRYERLVYKVAYGFTGGREAALDVVQAVFLKAWRNLDRFDGRAAWKTWLVRIALNEGLDWKRRFRRRDAPLDALDAIAERPAAGIGPEGAALAAEDRDRLRRGLDTLHPRHRQAVVLRYFEGQPVRDIAATLGCSEVTARNILFRSLRRLRTALAPSM
jgi:RNA polymerase sigma-70 factor (ECF subfamily)